MGDIKAISLTSTLLNDRVRPPGKHRRIIADNGPHGMIGVEWCVLPRNYCSQLVQDPKETPHQNGLFGSVVCPIGISPMQVLLDMSLHPPQSLLTQVAMTRNHVPHTATGILPEIAMTGRCELLAGHAATAWNHDPLSVDPAVRHVNSIRNIPNARNAIVTEDARRAPITCADRNLPDRSHEFAPVGFSVQIALRGERGGSYRVVGRSGSDIIAGKGRKVFKWQKYKVRLSMSHPEEDTGRAELPSSGSSEEEETDLPDVREDPMRYPVSRSPTTYDTPQPAPNDDDTELISDEAMEMFLGNK